MSVATCQKMLTRLANGTWDRSDSLQETGNCGGRAKEMHALKRDCRWRPEGRQGEGGAGDQGHRGLDLARKQAAGHPLGESVTTAGPEELEANPHVRHP